MLLALGLAACGEQAPDKKDAAVPVKPEVFAPAAKVALVTMPAKPASASDADSELARWVKEGLRTAPSLADAAIDVTASDGVTHLWGSDPSGAKRELAEEVALKIVDQVPRARPVDNRS